MKILSIILTVIFAILLISVLQGVYYSYISNSKFGFSVMEDILVDKIYIIEAIIGLVVFLVSIVLNVKKEYIINIIVSGFLIVTHLIFPIILLLWLKLV